MDSDTKMLLALLVLMGVVTFAILDIYRRLYKNKQEPDSVPPAHLRIGDSFLSKSRKDKRMKAETVLSN